MDKELFNKRLLELAELKQLKPVKVAHIRLDDTDLNEVRLPSGEWVHLDETTNPTLGYKFIKIKDQYKICELGCGDIISNQRIEKKLAMHPVKHWKTKCTNCGKYVKPNGQGFDISGQESQQSYRRFFTNKSQDLLENSKEHAQDQIASGAFGVDMPGVDTNGQEYTETVTKDHVIRKYK